MNAETTILYTNGKTQLRSIMAAHCDWGEVEWFYSYFVCDSRGLAECQQYGNLTIKLLPGKAAYNYRTILPLSRRPPEPLQFPGTTGLEVGKPELKGLIFIAELIGGQGHILAEGAGFCAPAVEELPQQAFLAAQASLG